MMEIGTTGTQEELSAADHQAATGPIWQAERTSMDQ